MPANEMSLICCSLPIFQREGGPPGPPPPVGLNAGGLIAQPLRTERTHIAGRRRLVYQILGIGACKPLIHLRVLCQGEDEEEIHTAVTELLHSRENLQEVFI